jgi:hypothetical protein
MKTPPATQRLASLGSRLRSIIEPLPWPLRILLLLVAALPLVLIVQQVKRRRDMPIRKRTIEHSGRAEPPQSIPREAQFNGQGERNLQTPGDGAGNFFHRRYRVDIANPKLTAEALIHEMQTKPNGFSPVSLAVFKKTKGDEGKMEVGDEYFIHITGPWDGPVRVIEVSPTSFSFATLEGHLEAGEIIFEATPLPDHADAIRFEIRSWARSKDKVVDLAYDKLGMAKAAQESMWIHFCERAVEVTEGDLIGKIDVTTEKMPYKGEEILRE